MSQKEEERFKRSSSTVERNYRTMIKNLLTGLLLDTLNELLATFL